MMTGRQDLDELDMDKLMQDALSTRDPERLLRVAEGLFSRGDLEASGAFFAEAARQAPAAFEHGIALAYLLGRLAAANDDDTRAQEAFEVAFEGQPENADYAYSLGEFHARRGRMNRAFDVVDEALEHNPGDERLLGLRADLVQRGAVSEHVLDPDEMALEDLIYAAENTFHEGDAEAAEWVLRHAERRFPDDPDVQLGLADALLMGSSPEAAGQVRRAASLAGGDAQRLTRVASHMFFIGDVSATRDLVAEAWRLASDDFELVALLEYTTALVADVDGDDAVAEQMFEAAFRREPESEQFGRSLALFHAQRGGKRRAREVVEEALKHSPGHDGLLEVQAALARPWSI